MISLKPKGQGVARLVSELGAHLRKKATPDTCVLRRCFETQQQVERGKVNGDTFLIPVGRQRPHGLGLGLLSFQ